MSDDGPALPFGSPPPAGGEVAYIDQALWRGLSEAADPEAFAAAWLALQVRMIPEVGGGLVLLAPDAGSRAVVAAEWPAGGRTRADLDAAARRAIEQRKGVVQHAESEAADADPRLLLAFPVIVAGVARGSAALEITDRPQAQMQAAMRQLQWGMAWLTGWLLRRAPGADPGPLPLEPRAADPRSGLALELAALTLEEEGFRPAATAAATELAARTRCDRVSVGFVDRRGRVKVRALSHSAEFGKEMNLIRAIGTAMSESIDQRSAVRVPAVADRDRTVTRAHDDLARTHGDGAVCSVPFVDRDGEGFGAITLERAVAEPFDDDERGALEAVAALLGPILEEKRLNDRLLITKAVDSLWLQLRRLVGPRYAVRKLVAIGLVALVAFFSVADGPFRVGAATTLEGRVQRAITAPFRGFVAEAPARGGDVVSEGQTLCALDVRDLQLEYSNWAAERERWVLEQRKALAEGDRAATNVLGKRVAQAEARIALLDEQMARARITAPFDGIVVSGDLSQSLGAPVDVGDVLFVIAPLESYRVALEVDERDIAYLVPGQRGTLILTALPRRALGFAVTKITPVSRTEEGKTFFEVEGELDELIDGLRPGMEGYAKIDVDERRLIWIWTHDLLNWVRLALWSWAP